MTDNETGPPDLLKIVRCGSKVPCGKRKAGFFGHICLNDVIFDERKI